MRLFFYDVHEVLVVNLVPVEHHGRLGVVERDDGLVQHGKHLLNRPVLVFQVGRGDDAVSAGVDLGVSGDEVRVHGTDFFPKLREDHSRFF